MADQLGGGTRPVGPVPRAASGPVPGSVARAMPSTVPGAASDDSVPGGSPDTAPEYVDFDPDDFPGGLRACLEAVLMSAEEPIAVADLARVLVQSPEAIQRALEALREDYAAQSRGFELLGSVRGWRFVSRPAYEPVVAAFLTDKQTSRLSQASLEALAIIAYKQPITRAGVSAIRGVNSDGVVRSLILRGLVEEASGPGGLAEPATGLSGEGSESRARLLVTAGLFLERIGLADLTGLPALAPFLPERVPAFDTGSADDRVPGELSLGAL